jgi:hypothetical protein
VIRSPAARATRRANDNIDRRGHVQLLFRSQSNPKRRLRDERMDERRPKHAGASLAQSRKVLRRAPKAESLENDVKSNKTPHKFGCGPTMHQTKRELILRQAAESPSNEPIHLAIDFGFSKNSDATRTR